MLRTNIALVSDEFVEGNMTHPWPLVHEESLSTDF